MEEKKKRTKKQEKIRTNEKKKEEEGKKGENFFEISAKGGPVKRKKKPYLNVWFGLG